MSAEFASVPLADHHQVGEFDCGVESLNVWLSQQSVCAQQAGTARTFVWVRPEAPRQVQAYFSLAPTEVARRPLSRGQSSGYSTVPG